MVVPSMSASEAPIMEPLIDFPLSQSNAGCPEGALDGSTGLKCTDRAAREEILHRARTIWKRRGEPQNVDLSIWLEAEAEILKNKKPGVG